MEEYSWQFVILAAILIFLARNSKNYSYYVKFMYYNCVLFCLLLGFLPYYAYNFYTREKPKSFLFFSKLLKKLSKYVFEIKWTVRGEEILKKSKSAIIVANHQTGLDVIGMSHIRVLTGHISAIAKKELMYAGPLGIAMYFGGMKFIDRSTREKAANDIKKFAEEIKEDEHKLWIFPEGKRFSDGKIHKFKHGAFNAAVHAEIPIIPIVISSYNNIIDFENKTFGKGEIIITVMPEVSTKGLASDDIPDLMEQVRDSMNEVYDKTSLK